MLQHDVRAVDRLATSSRASSRNCKCATCNLHTHTGHKATRPLHVRGMYAYKYITATATVQRFFECVCLYTDAHCASSTYHAHVPTASILPTTRGVPITTGPDSENRYVRLRLHVRAVRWLALVGASPWSPLLPSYFLFMAESVNQCGKKD
eukprot:scaffold6100_cov129-Isochrysis_galbana.AAC.1